MAPTDTRLHACLRILPTSLKVIAIELIVKHNIIIILAVLYILQYTYEASSAGVNHLQAYIIFK
jgi:hypothetical protein